MIAFRIDDLGFQNEAYQRLTNIFIKYNAKFSSGAVPLLDLKFPTNSFHELNQVWQHGSFHKSNSTNDKNEFPDERPQGEIEKELIAGREKLQRLYSTSYINGFIPPWNKASKKLISTLQKLNFEYISTDMKKHSHLKEINVNLDLHTNKYKKYSNTQDILLDLESTLKQNKYVFIMLHHNHMLNKDFDLFDNFLSQIINRYKIVWPTELL